MKNLIITLLLLLGGVVGDLAQAQGTSKSVVFEQNDPSGIAMAITAMSVVFSALLLLYLFFRTLGRVMHRKPAAVAAETPVVIAHGEQTGELTGEAIAAVALALTLYQNDLHDIESNVVTINKVARAYSPWSSKIYTLRQTPQRR